MSAELMAIMTHWIHSQNRARRRQFKIENPKPTKRKENVTLLSNTDYGKHAHDGDLDETFVAEESRGRTEALQINENERQQIGSDTIGQFGNIVYEQERRYCLSAWFFGQVIHRSAHTPCNNLVKSGLETSNFKSKDTEYGKINEYVAIKRLEELKDVKVDKSGLWIDLQHRFLDAFPDGLIGDDALVEVKCFLTGATKESLEKWMNHNKNSSKKNSIGLKMCGETIRLKRSHNYYYQVQGEHNICQRNSCFFILHLDDKEDIEFLF